MTIKIEDAVYMLYAVALKFEKSRNALNQKLHQAPFLLNPSTLETLAPDAIIPVRPRARFAYMQGLLTYLKLRSEEALLSADEVTVRNIEKGIVQASYVYFCIAVP